jgi:glutamine amidotransferase PdxT
MKQISNPINLILALLTLNLAACGASPEVTAIPNDSNELTSPVTSGDQTHSVTPTPTEDESKPLALIYKGPGSCSLDQGDAGESGYGCSEAAADVATQAGFRFQYVGPKDLVENATAAQVSALFGNAKVWMQPGGISNTAYYAMTTKLRNAIVNFVSNGGGYVGFCAGAFLATDWFGIFPGNSHIYHYTPERRDVGYAFLSFTWSGQNRKVYFEGGPYLSNVSSKAEIMATFSTGYVAAARSAYGKGRVYISGPHPEAPAIWANEDGINDPDGSDLDIGASMVTWAAGL